MERSNYDIARDQAKKIFLQYDQKKMIRKWKLSHDESYLYVKFVGREYGIDRQNGTILWTQDDGTVQEADFNVTLTIFDILCCAREDCFAAGQYDLVKNLKGTGYGGDPGSDLYVSYRALFDQKQEELKTACRALGGEPFPVGDAAFIIPIFDDLKMLFQFWAADEEFDAEIKLKWDIHVLRYMRFETVYYAMGHVLERIAELIS